MPKPWTGPTLQGEGQITSRVNLKHLKCSQEQHEDPHEDTKIRSRKTMWFTCFAHGGATAAGGRELTILRLHNKGTSFR